MLIKKLLKKHKYPPEGMEDAVQTVMTQCELWTDQASFSFEEPETPWIFDDNRTVQSLAAEGSPEYTT